MLVQYLSLIIDRFAFPGGGALGEGVTIGTSAELPQCIADDRLRRLYNYWDGLRGARICPSRREVDPLQLQFILGNLSLIDVLADSGDFRIRLHGTELARRSGRELTGLLLSDLTSEDFRDRAAVHFAQVATTAAPLHVRDERIIDKRPVMYECVMLPLSENGMSVDTLLNGIIYL